MIATPSPRAVVMACSAAKRSARARADQLYLGPAWTVYRTALTKLPPALQPALLIVSARHGMLTPERVIAPYETRLDNRRLRVLLADPRHVAITRDFLRRHQPALVFLGAGALYRLFAKHCLRYAGYQGPLIRPYGRDGTPRGHGDLLAALRQFLYAKPA